MWYNFALKFRQQINEITWVVLEFKISLLIDTCLFQLNNIFIDQSTIIDNPDGLIELNESIEQLSDGRDAFNFNMI